MLGCGCRAEGRTKLPRPPAPFSSLFASSLDGSPAGMPARGSAASPQRCPLTEIGITSLHSRTLLGHSWGLVPSCLPRLHFFYPGNGEWRRDKCLLLEKAPPPMACGSPIHTMLKNATSVLACVNGFVLLHWSEKVHILQKLPPRQCAEICRAPCLS